VTTIEQETLAGLAAAAPTILVLDYSFTHPTVGQLKTAGVKAVGRYLGQAMSEPKNLSAAEAESLSAAGIEIFTNFEYGAQQALGGARQAVADVALARAQRKQVGMPLGRPFYFAYDWDIPDYAPSLPNDGDPAHALAKLGPAGRYAQVIRQEMGPNAGGYGGYWAIKRLFDANLISWGFQTIAWSGGQWDPRACLRQTGQTVFGQVADVDKPERTDFGQWLHGQPPPQPPPAVPGPTKAQALVAARTLMAYLEAL
jgi:hypothetical protein